MATPMLHPLSRMDSHSIAEWLERYGELTGNLCDLIAFLFITPEIVRKLELPFTPRQLFLVYYIICLIAMSFFGFLSPDAYDRSDSIKSAIGLGIIILILLIRIRKNKSIALPHTISISLALFAFLAARMIGVTHGLFNAGWLRK
jgi:hypothetical protein